MAGSVLAGRAGIGDDADALGLVLRVTISPVNSLFSVYLKVPMVAMSVSP
jgi:hypothetical protein